MPSTSAIPASPAKCTTFPGGTPSSHTSVGPITRFFSYAKDVPGAAIDYLAGLVGVESEAFAKYSWTDRRIKRHRAQIRQAQRFALGSVEGQGFRRRAVDFLARRLSYRVTIRGWCYQFRAHG
jgi:Domain of unknown function (DUF4158)